MSTVELSQFSNPLRDTEDADTWSVFLLVPRNGGPGECRAW